MDICLNRSIVQLAAEPWKRNERVRDFNQQRINTQCFADQRSFGRKQPVKIAQRGVGKTIPGQLDYQTIRRFCCG